MHSDPTRDGDRFQPSIFLPTVWNWRWNMIAYLPPHKETLQRQYVEWATHLWKCCNFMLKWPIVSVQICWMPQDLFTTMIANSLTLIQTSYICFSCTNYTKANLPVVFVVFPLHIHRSFEKYWSTVSTNKCFHEHY